MYEYYYIIIYFLKLFYFTYVHENHLEVMISHENQDEVEIYFVATIRGYRCSAFIN